MLSSTLSRQLQQGRKVVLRGVTRKTLVFDCHLHVLTSLLSLFRSSLFAIRRHATLLGVPCRRRCRRSTSARETVHEASLSHERLVE